MDILSECKKKICVLTVEKNSSDFMVNEIQNIIGEFAVVQGYCFEDDFKDINIAKFIEISDIIVTAGEKSYTMAKSLTAKNKVIVARRSISSENLEELSLLPNGRTVLTVNYSYEATMKTISSLKDLGLNHLKYIPYWKDCDVDTQDIEIAISPGMIHLCPNDINKKIDIGMRNINYTTYVEICVSLDIKLEVLSRFAIQYIKTLVDTYKRLNQERQRVEAINLNMQGILNNIDKGYMFIDKSYNISAINKFFAKALGKSEGEMLGFNITNLTQEHPEIEHLLNPDFINKNGYINLKGKQYLGSCLSVMKESGANYVLTIQESKEKNLRESRSRIIPADNGFSARWSFDDMVGKSQAMIDLIQKAKLMALTDSTILVTGESGTGKELMAHSIHNESYRKDAPFIAANFAAIPENLVESELFGYEDGAFTGSKKGGYAGLFEQANGGTIFLDEIGDASHHTQKRLLRVLQGKEIMRLGSARRIFLDVRIIAATNRDLKELIIKGLFREDLYFRLRVCTLKIPPLRDRKEDVIRFLYAFLNKYNVKKDVSREVEQLLLDHDWTGNVRELENVIEYISNVSQGSIITVLDLPEDFKTDVIDLATDSATDSIFDLFNVEDVKFILDTIYYAKQQNITLGRNKLSQMAMEQGKNLSEGKIRTRLSKMSDYGLIISGKTKQGILITNKGEALLSKLKADEN
jgi:sigma-54 dependent transcriptional regulator, acetoin dehydrogenase operon transcriptional activator AcoR